MRNKGSSALRVAVRLVLALLASCALSWVATASAFAQGTPATLTPVSGSGQSTIVNTFFPNTLKVIVQDGAGDVLANVPVTFTAPAGSGSTTANAIFNSAGNSITVNSDGSGTATVPAALVKASLVANQYNIDVTAGSAATTILLINAAGPPATITISAGAGQMSTVGTALPLQFTALVVDSYGNPAPGVGVTFTAPGSGASGTFSGLLTALTTTNSSGLATAPTFTLNTTSGPFNVLANATVTPLSTPANFNLVALPAAASRITVNQSSGQSTQVTTAFATLLKALVTDTNNNPVPNVDVTFTAPSTGASGTFTGGGAIVTVTTDSSGIATATTLTAGTTAGTFNVSASISGGASVNFALTNTPGTAASIAVQAGDNQSATVTLNFSTNLAVVVRDANGNTISGATVTYTSPGSGASGTFGSALTKTATTNATGVATATTFTANSIVGSYSIVVTYGTLSVSFNLTNIAPSSISMSAGSSQSATITTSFGTILAAKVSDASGTGIAGLVVTFTAPGSGASGLFGSSLTATATTNSSGIATAPSFKANSTAGSYSVTATVAGVGSPASFSLTNDNPAAILAQAGSVQQATINTAFPTRLTARVTNGSGVGIAGLTVTFTAASSGPSGTFSGSLTTTAVTNASGDAQASVLTANGNVGAHSVVATVAGVAIGTPFVLTNLAPIPVTVTASPTNGTPQTAPLNTAFATALGVLVKDINGYVISGQSVTFTVNGLLGAGATFAGGSSSTTVTTTSSGIATAPTLTANGSAGTYTVTATAGLVSFTFTLTNQAPSQIRATAGGSQSAVINTNFANQLQATVLDSSNNPVVGITVTFTAPGSGASGAFSGSATTSAVTNSSGVATSAVIRANGTGGSYIVTASVAGVATAADFSLTNMVPSTVSATAGTPQTTVVSTNFGAQLQATVLDASNTAVAGATVTFAAPGSGASGTFGGAVTATAVTNASGVATAAVLKANATAGTFSVNATVSGVSSPAVFNLTNNLATAATATASPSNGTPQSTAVNTAFSNTLGLLVLDSSGTIIVGIPVTFTVNAVSGAGATFSGGGTTTTVNTNASGIATAATLMANGTTGTYTVTATVGSLTVTFSLSNTAVPGTITASAGNNQSQTLSTNFTTQLQALVSNSSGSPIAGAVVIFSAPTSGARATFSGSSTATATTNASGLATAPIALAGTTAGGYSVSATVQGTALTTNFTLTNTPGAPSTITRVSGNAQSGPLGADFSQVLVAVVKDASGNVVPGVSVTFSAPTTGARATFAGAASTATATTDSSGNATSPTFTAVGSTGSYSISAKVNNSSPSVTFTATNLAAVPGSIAMQAGTSQSTVVNTSFTTALQAKVLDTLGNPVANVTITFTLPGTGASGTFSGALTATATTNSSGIATSPTLRANTTAGTFFAQATASGITNPATYTLTNNPDAPVSIAIVSGTPQVTIVNTAFAAPLIALVKDVFNNPVPNASVNFLAPTVGSVAKFPGSASSATVTTDSTGKATSPTLTANSIAGSYTITASIASGAFVNYNLTNTPAPVSIAATGGGAQSTRVTTAFATQLQVIVKDATNFPVPGVTVTFSGPSSGAAATLPSNTVTTDSSGVASLAVTANSIAGSYVVTAIVTGVSTPATFNLTNTPNVPSALTATGGGTQSTRVFTAFTTPLQVTVTDSSSNPVPGITVTFAAPGSAATATLSSTTATTDASGNASVTATANSTPGTYSVTASVSGVSSPASFSLTNTVSGPAAITVTGGGVQSTRITTAFASPLQVAVKDATNNPLANTSVTFSTQSSGPTATLSSTTAMTDPSGIASVRATANGMVGTYSVTAVVVGAAAPAMFSLSNTGTPGLQLGVTASVTSFAAPGQTIVFSYSVLNTGNVAISGMVVTDNKVPNVVCATTSLAPAAATVCSASYVTTPTDITNRNVVSVARATGTTVAGAATSPTVTTKIGIDVEAIRRQTTAANRSLMQSRAQAMTSMGPNAQRLHNRLSTPIFGDIPDNPEADDPTSATPSPAPVRRHEPLKLGGSQEVGVAGGAPTGGFLGAFRGASGIPQMPSVGADNPGFPGMGFGVQSDASRVDNGRTSPKMPFAFSGSADDGSGRFAFAASLSQMREAAKADDAAKLAAADVSARANGLNFSPYNPNGKKKGDDTFDIWVEGQSSYFNTNNPFEGRRQGHAAVLYTGADVIVRPGVLLGFLYQRDWIKDSSPLAGLNRSGEGWMAGPYIGLRLTQNLFFDARYAHGFSQQQGRPDRCLYRLVHDEP